VKRVKFGQTVKTACGVWLLRYSGQSGASFGEEDISAVLGPGQVGPKLDDSLSISTVGRSPSGEIDNSPAMPCVCC